MIDQGCWRSFDIWFIASDNPFHLRFLIMPASIMYSLFTLQKIRSWKQEAPLRKKEFTANIPQRQIMPPTCTIAGNTAPQKTA